MKLFRKLSKWVVGIMLGGVAILDIALTFSSRASFISHWNAQAAKYHSLPYDKFVSAAHAAGAATPTHWTWGDTFGATAGIFMNFIWAFGISYVGGEVKRPDKTVIRAQIATVSLPAILCLWALFAINHIIPFSFLRAAAWQDYQTYIAGAVGVKAYTVPFQTSYMSLAYLASGGNAFIAVVAGITFMITAMWLVVVNVLMCQRAMFAWGMDRMGPKWFTSVSGRYAAPVGMYAFVAALSAILVAGYWYLFPNVLSGLFASGIQLVSVFGVTAISAIIFAYRKKVAHIWDASPYKRWKLFGVPVLTIAGSVYLGYVIALLYFAFVDPKTRGITSKADWMMLGAWVAGVSWYFAWKYVSKRKGVDVVHTTYGQLPPE